MGKLRIKQCHLSDLRSLSLARFNIPPVRSHLPLFLHHSSPSSLPVWSSRALLGACMLEVSASTFADFPDKPIRVVTGFPAGGPLGQHVRLIAERLQAVLGQPIIDKQSGAGGAVGAQDVGWSSRVPMPPSWVATRVASEA